MNDLDFMARAIELAARGRLKVQPNPMVGCVIVKNNKIIGEGWHKEYGNDHAEINAIKNCKRIFGAKKALKLKGMKDLIDNEIKTAFNHKNLTVINNNKDCPQIHLFLIDPK